MIGTLLSTKIKTDKGEDVLQEKFADAQKQCGATGRLQVINYPEPITKWTDEVKKTISKVMRDKNCSNVAIKVDDGYLVGSWV